MKKILVTGSSGTIGTALCIELLKKGYDVTGVDLKRNKWANRVDQCTISTDLRLWGDKLPWELILDYDLIIHLAANAKVHQSVKTPYLARDNFEMAFNVLEFARTTNTPIIFASSREVYGDSPFNAEGGSQYKRYEEDPVLFDLKSPYAATKVAAEALACAYNQSYNLNFLILRLSNVYGKYDDSERVIPTWIKAARNGENLIVYGKGKAYDFTYIDDCVAAFMLGIKRFRFKSVKNGTFNIASGKATKLTDLAALIQKETNGKGGLDIKATRVGEVDFYRADIENAEVDLKFKAKVDIKEGIKKTVEWYNQNIK